MREFGALLLASLQPGDLILLNGDLGAGKTTLVQGIGQALGIDHLTSPTFVMAKIYPVAGRFAKLIHVDAYRLIGDPLALFDDLDLESQMPAALTVIEWGENFIDRLGSEYLEIEIKTSVEGELEARHLELVGHGQRWQGVRI